MSFYPEQINELFLAPLNAGETKATNGAGTAGSFVCGAVLRLTLRIDSNARVIEEAKFKASGCGFLIAAASLLTESIKSAKLEEAAALCSKTDLFETYFVENLCEVSDERRHCVSLCRDALQAALNDYHNAALEEWHGDEALICTCFGVSETTIEKAIQENSLETISEVTRACNAGGGCGSCHPLIEEILESDLRFTKL